MKGRYIQREATLTTGLWGSIQVTSLIDGMWLNFCISFVPDILTLSFCLFVGCWPTQARLSIWWQMTLILFISFQACSDPKSRPAFLNEKSLEAALKIIVKKFPAMENNKAPHMQAVMQMHLDVVKGLSNYYLTFVDVMIFKVCSALGVKL